MNTVVKNSLDQDQTVNQEHTQFTNPNTTSGQQGTSFVSQFDTQTSAKKDQAQGQVKLSTSDVHVYYGEAEAIKGIDCIYWAIGLR